nr:PREDICTED: odorant receptor 2a-like [Linepithema humile]
MQVLCNTIVSCCLGFIFIISIYNETNVFVLVKAILAYITIMLELFILCFAGEYLSLKNESIADAAYDSLWYDMPSNYGKIITFIIMRSQSQLKITAGKFMDLSLEAFANILKASASYISVFNAIY